MISDITAIMHAISKPYTIVPPKITATNTIPEQPTSHQPTALRPGFAGSDAFVQNLVIACLNDEDFDELKRFYEYKKF
jgi:hypothetical protein